MPPPVITVHSPQCRYDGWFPSSHCSTDTMIRSAFSRLSYQLKAAFLLCLIVVTLTFVYLSPSLNKYARITGYSFGPISYKDAFWRVDKTGENVHDQISDQAWSLVHGRQLILRSAYADLAESSQVRILAYKHCEETRNVSCDFKSKFVEYFSKATGYFDLINTPNDGDCLGYDKYDSFFLYCSLPLVPGGLALFRPTTVAVSTFDSGTISASTPLQIRYVPTSRSQFAVCVAPMHDWNDTHQTVLFIEYYLSQGVDHFVFYNHSSSPAVSSLLNEYQKLGLVEVVQWSSLPTPDVSKDNPNRKLHYYGQILSMNDCLWKLRTRAKYVALVDLDELIVPLESEKTTILELVQRLDKKGIGGFMFLSAYTFVQFPWNEETNVTDWFKLFDMSELTIFRDRDIFPETVRSKVIVKPEAILKQTVHQAWKYSPAYGRHVVRSSTALLYHLRPLTAKTPSAAEDTRLRNRLRSLFRFNLTDVGPL